MTDILRENGDLSQKTWSVDAVTPPSPGTAYLLTSHEVFDGEGGKPRRLEWVQIL